MRIDARIARGTPAAAHLSAEIEKLLERYRAAANGKLTIAIVEAKDAITLTFSYRGEEDAIGALPVDHPEHLEVTVASALRTFVDRVDGATHGIGILTGHGERRLDAFDLVTHPTSGAQASMASIITKYFPSYRLIDVDLARGDRDVDPTLEGLLVLQPSTDLNEKELRRIDAFVMSGKSLFVAASAANVARKSGLLRAQVGAHRLDRLLGGYGITLNEDVLLDFTAHFSLEVQTPTGSARMRFPQIPRPEGKAIDDRFPPFFRVGELALPFASSVDVRPEVQPKARVHVVARTSAHASVERFTDVDLSITRRWQAPRAMTEIPIAAAAEGMLQSAFGNGTSMRPARVLLVASASPFANPFVGAPGTTTDIEDHLVQPYAQASLTNAVLVLKNTLDWMTAEDDLASCLPEMRTSR
jgi:hypothetical protein